MKQSEPYAGELERLSSLALAAGADFNDELTMILNCADTSRQMLGAGHPAEPQLAGLQAAVMRCAETTRWLLLVTERAREVIRYAKARTRHENSGNRELV